MMRLVETIETEVRARLADQLAPIPNAPPRIIHSLAFDDEIEVARPVLMQSERLDEATLVRNAATKGQAHLLAIAQRKQSARRSPTCSFSAATHRSCYDGGKQGREIFRQWLCGADPALGAETNSLRLLVGARPELPRHQFLKLLTIASTRGPHATGAGKSAGGG